MGSRLLLSAAAALFLACLQTAAAQTPPPNVLDHDQRISSGASLGSAFGGDPAAAYNPNTGKIVVVFTARDSEGRQEIWGQVVDATTHQNVGDRFQISFQNPMGINTFSAREPRIVYNAFHQQFFVVWRGDTDNLGHIDDEYLIYGQPLDSAGVAIGNPLMISNDLSTLVYEVSPDVTYNTTTGEYLVVWIENSYDGLAAAAKEVWGRTVTPSGGSFNLGTPLRISDMDPTTTGSYDAFRARVVFNSAHNEYMVVWDGRAAPLASGKSEVYYRMLDADLNLLTSQARVTDTGDASDNSRSASFPAVVINPQADEYAIVWEANLASPTEKKEIFGLRLDGTTQGLIGGVQQISNTSGGASVQARAPSVAYDPVTSRFFVAYYADPDTTPFVDDEFEIFGVALDNTLAPLSSPAMQLSSTGADGNANFIAIIPSVVFIPERQRFHVFYEADRFIGGPEEQWDVWRSAVGDEASITMGLSDGASSVQPGGSLTYTVTVTNNGPHMARSLYVSGTIPAGVTLTAASGTGWSCSTASGLECSLSELAPAASSTFTFTVSVGGSAAGVLTTSTSLESITYGASTTASDTTSVTAPTPVPTAVSTVAPTVAQPTATPTPVVQCSLSVERACKGTVTKGKSCFT